MCERNKLYFVWGISGIEFIVSQIKAGSNSGHSGLHWRWDGHGNNRTKGKFTETIKCKNLFIYETISIASVV
jgi:hypothetical protein